MRRAVIVALLAWASCTAIAWSAEPAPAKDQPDPMQDWLAKLTPEQREQINAYESFQARLKEQLRTSADPRDWALSTQLHLFFGSDGKNDDPVTLMRNAASAAPTDVLVQWWAGNVREHSAGTCGLSLPRPEIVAALQAMEPDNGAVWMLGLDAAAQAKDEAAVDRLLIQIAAAKRFDTHYLDGLKAWSNVYERFGMPQMEQTDASVDGIPVSTSAQRHFMAMSNATMNTPSYSTLTQACKVTAGNEGEQFHRASLCEEAGRHVATVSKTILDQRIGLAVVRAAGREQDQDLQHQRELDWAGSSLARNAIFLDADAYYADWLSTGDELEAGRRALQRAQLESEVPAWWSPKQDRDDEAETDD